MNFHIRVDEAKKLTKEEIAEIKAEVLKTDEKAKVLHAEMKQFSELIKSTHNKVKIYLSGLYLLFT
jgi:ribonuclease HIII